MEKFYLEDFLTARQKNYDNKDIKSKLRRVEDFYTVCRQIKDSFLEDWNKGDQDINSILRIQKKAITGHTNEIAYFKEKIRAKLEESGYGEMEHPKWYASAEDGIYHENWGLAGLVEWFSNNYKESSSAKVIGDRIYFMEKGKMILKPQRISKERREQLLRAFLLLTPEERLDKEFHELYMLDGTRVTIYGGGMTKKNQDTMIFRRYVIPIFSFEEQALRGTIPYDAIPLFESMVKLGFNVAFTGAVRSAKTTFLSTWQSYERPELEGVMVETDPEIPLHSMMPDAPIVQIIADNDKLKNITKSLLRSDADYFIMAEARDGIALDTVVKLASKGTRRLKITFHERDPYDFPYDVAAEIVKSMGGDLIITANNVAKSFDYIFHFIQLKRRDKKRLSGIYEISFNSLENKIEMQEICKYNFLTDDWTWRYYMSDGKKKIGIEEDVEGFDMFTEKFMLMKGLKRNEQ